MTSIVLVLHGQTEWEREERFRGRADVPLNEAGVAAAEAMARRIAAEWQPAAIYSSPLSRAVQTAGSIARPFSLPVQIHRGLTDIDYGQWQGLTLEEVRERWPETVDAWYRTPEAVQIPGGERIDSVRVRATEAVHEAAMRHQGKALVVVGHTVVNRLILLGVLGLRTHRLWRLGQDTGAINVFEIDGDDSTLISMNDTCHLRAPWW